MQRAIAQRAAQCAVAAPVARRVDGDFARDIVLVVVDVEPQGAADVVFDKLAEPGLTVEGALGGPEDVVAVRKETGEVCWGGGGDVENVPDVGDCGEGGPLEG